MSDKKDSLRAVTPPAILSYPHLFEPWAGPKGDQTPKYSACFVFPAGTDLSELKAKALAAARAKWGDKADELIRANKIRMPFREDVEGKGYPEGSVFIICRNDSPPGVVSRFAGDDGKPRAITKEEQVNGNANEMYPGVIVRGLVGAFAYDNVNKGVSFGLNGVQRIEDGTRLDNRVAAADVFTADMKEQPASLDDLM
jgi:hypothetical protein